MKNDGPEPSKMFMRLTCLFLYVILTCRTEDLVAQGPLENDPAWSVSISACKKDAKAWKNYYPLEEWMDRQVPNWRKKPKSAAFFDEYREIDRRNWRKEDVADETWTDINGDGWCDVITSGEIEPFKSLPGMPVLLMQPRCIYIRTPNGFKTYQPGMISSEYEGMSFTLYWNKLEKSTVIVMRVYQGNLMNAGGQAENEFHFRQLLRAAFRALALENNDVYSAYYEEARPYLYNGVLEEELAKSIWLEEAQRAGVRDRFN